MEKFLNKLGEKEQEVKSVPSIKKTDEKHVDKNKFITQFYEKNEVSYFSSSTLWFDLKSKLIK